MKLPKWAVFVARDLDGNLHVFEHEPAKAKIFPDWVPMSLESKSEKIDDHNNIFEGVEWSDIKATNIKDYALSLMKEAESLKEIGDALIRNWERENGIPEALSVSEYNQWQLIQARAHGYSEPPVLYPEQTQYKRMTYKNRFTGEVCSFKEELSKCEMTFLDLEYFGEEEAR